MKDREALLNKTKAALNYLEEDIQLLLSSGNFVNRKLYKVSDIEFEALVTDVRARLAQSVIENVVAEDMLETRKAQFSKNYDDLLGELTSEAEANEPVKKPKGGRILRFPVADPKKP